MRAVEESKCCGQRSTGTVFVGGQGLTVAKQRPHHPLQCTVAQIFAHVNWGLQKSFLSWKKNKKICAAELSDQTIREGWQLQGPTAFLFNLPCSIPAYTAKPQLTDGEILREGSRLMALQLWVFWVGRGKCVLVHRLLWGKKVFPKLVQYKLSCLSKQNV